MTTLTNNNLPVIDLAPWEVLNASLVSAASGACVCNDPRGTDPYIYLLAAGTQLWRYSTRGNTWQQLASIPGGTIAIPTAICYDVSRGSIWAVVNDGVAATTFQEYTISTNTWVAKSITNLPSPFTANPISITHTDSTVNAAGNDDFIYLIGNGATPLYRYSISGNAWITTLAAAPATQFSYGSFWLPGWNTDRIITFRGAATVTAYYYGIAGNAWTTVAYQPQTETITTGSWIVPRGLGPKVFVQKDATMRIYQLDFSVGSPIMDPYVTQFALPTSTVVVGNKMCYVKDPTYGVEFIYTLLHSSVSFLRTPLIW